MMRWQRTHYQDKETIATLLCESEFISAGREALKSTRSELEDYIVKDPQFAETHAPHDSLPDAPDFVQQMCSVSRQVGVGPMASVAGMFAVRALEGMILSGSKEGVVDNGGDIALRIRESIHVGIYAGRSSIRNLAFQIETRDSILGICTSSGTVGHSFSYGKADAAIVISENVMLADAAATALGNRIQTASDLESCFDFMEPIPEIEGALVILDDKIAMWGDLPKLVRMHVDETLITCGHPDQ